MKERPILLGALIASPHRRLSHTSHPFLLGWNYVCMAHNVSWPKLSSIPGIAHTKRSTLLSLSATSFALESTPSRRRLVPSCLLLRVISSICLGIRPLPACPSRKHFLISSPFFVSLACSSACYYLISSNSDFLQASFNTYLCSKAVRSF